MNELITRAIRFTNTTRPNSVENRRAIQIVRELLIHINDLELEKERAECIRQQQLQRIQKLETLVE